MIEHQFKEGVTGRAPVREWTVTAPLYYFATPDFMGVAQPFCSAPCCTRWHDKHRVTV